MARHRISPGEAAAFMAATVPGFEPVRVKPGDLAELAAVLWRVSPVELREGDGARGARGKLGEAWRLLQDAAKVAALEGAAFDKARKARRGRPAKKRPGDFAGTRAEDVLFKAKGGAIERVPVTPFELARLAAEMNKAHLAGLREAWEVLQSAAVVEAEQMAAFHARAEALKDEREALAAAGFGTDGDEVYFWKDLWPKLRVLLKDGQVVSRKTREALGLPLGASKAKNEDLLLALIFENWTDDKRPVRERAAAARRELAGLKSGYAAVALVPWSKLKGLLKAGQVVCKATRAALWPKGEKSKAKICGEDLLLALIFENWTDDKRPVRERAAAARREHDGLKSGCAAEALVPWSKLKGLLKGGQVICKETREALWPKGEKSKAKICGEDLLLALIFENWTDDKRPVSERAAAARREHDGLKSGYFNGYGAASWVDQVKEWRAARGKRKGQTGRAEGRRNSPVAKPGAQPVKKITK